MPPARASRVRVPAVRAVMPFSQSAPDQRCTNPPLTRCILRAAALEADGLKLAPSEQNGGFRLSQYGPLYTLKPRRNELLLRVSLS